MTRPFVFSTHARLLALYLRAQENHDFAVIYEQRRTSAFLIAGFRSLNEAVRGLGDRMVDAISSLRASLDFRLGSIEASLENAATAAVEQRNALMAEIRQSNDTQAEGFQQLRKDAENRSEHERATRRMLDNIQRHRKPRFFDTP